MLTAKRLATYLDELLHVKLIKDYCPNGLQVAGRSDIKKIVTGVTASQALIEASIAEGADAILTHHGYFWKHEAEPLIHLKGQRIAALLRADINLLSYHLPLDLHVSLGNNAQLARVLDIKVLETRDGDGVKDLVWLGELMQPMSPIQFTQHLTQRLARAPLAITPSDKPITRLAWCTGGAQSLAYEISSWNVDAYLTGEASEKNFHIANESGMHFFAAGHHATERYGIQALGEHLAQEFGIEHRFIEIYNPI